jgi:ribonucleoside-diphosphate reductase alpha chain
MGHVRMMGAVQPFLSGAISKTVNLPEDASVGDVEEAYVEGWKLGLKALAIYRDGSKRTQPLNSGKDEGAPVTQLDEYRPRRRKLPDERHAFTHKFSIAGHEGYLTVGNYDDGAPGEIFLKMAKEGSTISGLMDTIATMTSIALQYGVPLKALVDKFSHTRFEPSGFTNNREIPIAKSITDYIFRYLASRYLTTEQKQAAGVILRDLPRQHDPEPEVLESAEPRALGAGEAADEQAQPENSKVTFLLQQDAPSCHECGAIMVRNGSCYKCLNCGSTSGCS